MGSTFPDGFRAGTAIRRQQTRYGEKNGCIFFPTEQRFGWQNALGKPDVFYSLPSTADHRAPLFGTSTREDWQSTRMNKRDVYNPNVGPGSYRVQNEHKLLSTHRDTSRGGSFSEAARPDMALTTPGPGPAYDLSGLYTRGPDTTPAIGFNRDHRRPLSDNVKSRTDAMYSPKLPPSKYTTFGKAAVINRKYKLGTESPGFIYDTSCINFRTGPAYSFGVSKVERFARAEPD